MFRLIQKWIAWFAVLVSDFNAMRDALQRAGVVVHNAATAVLDGPAATDTASAIVRANALKAAYNAHRQSAAAHLAVDATNAVTSANATDQASLNALLNEIKADFNAHHKSASYHHVGGPGGLAVSADVSTADASSESTSVALVNALVAAFNRHVSSGFAAVTPPV